MTEPSAVRAVSRRQVLAGLGAGGVLLAAGGLAACSTTGGSGSSGPTGAAGAAVAVGPTLAEPTELRSADGRLDVTLVADSTMVPHGDGTRYALTYNGSTPGPTLRIKPGDLLTITLDNRLDTTTNLHTHGLHVSPEGDADNVFVMVDPGQQHTYRYQIPADHPSGTFWYHPHHHGQVAAQVIGGLAGAIVVEDGIDEQPPLASATDRVLVLSDPRIGPSAGVLGVTMADQMLGREGDVITVNGQVTPRVPSRTGALEQWRLVNASPSRYYALRLDGHPFQVIASDSGRLDRLHTTDELVLTPGERAEVLVPLAAPGSFALTTRPVDRGGMGMMGQGGGAGRGARTNPSTPGGVTTVAVLDVAGEPTSAPAVPTSLRELGEAPASSVVRTRDVTLSMTMGGGMGMRGNGDGEFLIDGKSFDAGRIDTASTLGTTEDWVLRNTSTMDHPFHLHVWPFRVVEASTGPVPSGWKDTVNVPAGGSVRIRIPFRDIEGKAVYHCHILDHEDLGMMGVIDVRSV